MELSNNKKFKRIYGFVDSKVYLPIIIFGIGIILGVIEVYSDNLLGIIVLLISALCIIDLIYPYTKQYCLEYPYLYLKQGKKNTIIQLSKPYSLIFSSLEIENTAGSKTYLISGRMWISILYADEKSNIIDTLHQNIRNRYSNISIKRNFDEKYISGFVYDNLMEDTLFANASYIVFPKSCLKTVPLPHLNNCADRIIIDDDF